MKIKSKLILVIILSLSYKAAFAQPNSYQKKIERRINKIENDISYQKNQLSIKKRENDSTEKRNNNRIDSIVMKQEINEAKLKLQNSDEKGWLDFFKDLLVEIAGAIVGALTAICIFISQQKREKRKEEDKKRNEDKERVMYMIELSKSTIKITKPWADGLVEVSQAIVANKEEVPLLPMVPTQDVERLLKLFDNESYFHAFLSYFGSNEENLKRFKSISNAADFIIAQIRQAYETHDKATNFDYQRKLKFQELFETNKSLCAELTKSHPVEDLKKVLNNHLVNYHNKYNQPTTLQNIEQDYIQPLLKELLKNWSSDESARTILSQLKELRTIYDNITRQNVHHSENSNEFGVNLTNALTEISNQIKALDKI